MFVNALVSAEMRDARFGVASEDGAWRERMGRNESCRPLRDEARTMTFSDLLHQPYGLEYSTTSDLDRIGRHYLIERWRPSSACQFDNVFHKTPLKRETRPTRAARAYFQRMMALLTLRMWHIGVALSNYYSMKVLYLLQANLSRKGPHAEPTARQLQETCYIRQPPLKIT